MLICLCNPTFPPSGVSNGSIIPHCELCSRLDVLINNKCVNFCSLEEQAKIIKKHTKRKELRILNILKTEYREPDEYNKRVSFDCGNKNSEEKEIGYDYGTHKIFVEVDENQHKSYCELGEVNRMRNIHQNEGGIPVLFIRYNPDNFSENRKNKIPQAKREELLIKWLKFYEDVNNVKHDLNLKSYIINACLRRNIELDRPEKDWELLRGRAISEN